MTKKAQIQKKEAPKNDSGMIAQADFHFFCPPEYDVRIKKGDDVSKLDLPEWEIKKLIIEGILKG